MKEEQITSLFSIKMPYAAHVKRQQIFKKNEKKKIKKICCITQHIEKKTLKKFIKKTRSKKKKRKKKTKRNKQNPNSVKQNEIDCIRFYDDSQEKKKQVKK